mgnify:CR=1 FL=1
MIDSIKDKEQYLKLQSLHDLGELHISYWNKNSFWYYTDRNYAEFADAGVRFQVFKLEDYFPTEFMRDNNILVTCAVLVAIKNNNIRFPGPLKI